MTQEQILRDTLLTVSEITNVPPNKILKRDRHKEVSDSRKILYYILKNQHKMGWSTIGRLVGYKHCTVMYGYRYVSDNWMYDVDIMKYKAKADKLEPNDCTKVRDNIRSVIRSGRNIDQKIEAIINILLK